MSLVHSSLPFSSPTTKKLFLHTKNMLMEDRSSQREPSPKRSRRDGTERRRTKHSSDSTQAPRSRSFFQHADRVSVGQNGRSFGHKTHKDIASPNPRYRAVGSGRRDARGHRDKHERPFSGEREYNKGEAWRGNFSSRDRNGSNSRYHGKDKFTAGQGSRPTGGRVEKCKHDLYNEANRSPTPKNEKDQISKIEALLSS